MATYNATSKINLEVNGSQANKIFNQLKKEAEQLRKKIDEAALAGDKVAMKKLQQDLNNNKRLMQQLSTETASVEQTLSRLDRASPKELNKTLNSLRKQLNNIERGSEAWNKQVEMIKQVKEEIDKVNSSMRAPESRWSRMNRWLNDCQTAIMGMAAAVTGLAMAGRKAVESYAEMEQEMANVRKFTGMTEEEVASLNAEFKKIDTRSSREHLNQLAQEAGRLGKTSPEAVLGYVRAADKINVALDDLGEGATLTLSKLTGIFGDEKRLGTEKSLLAVGSVINELSQNCSASAPYLAQFASRMGGVGAQAGLTVQQIMGYAAVLDSNNQTLEASATALSQVMVRIYQDPAKYAKVAGMDVKKFTQLVKEDMNQAFIFFMSCLKKAGNMDVLSPMFKNMGENGSRAISAMSTLASHIDEVVAQQEAANKAFSEATSIDNEFNVQNNTVMAGLEKAKKRVNEIAVELGEKLQPVMSHIISGSGIMLRFLSQSVDFIIANKKEIAFAAIGLATYNAAVLVYNARVSMAAKSTVIWNAAVKFCNGVGPAAKLMFAALANGIQYFTNGLQVNYDMQMRWQKAMAAMKMTSWIGLITTAASVLFILGQRYSDMQRKMKEANEQRKKQIREMTDISKAALEKYSEEISKLKYLYDAANNEAKSKEERIKAARQLISLYPDQFGQMTTEQIMLGKAKTAYDELTKSIIANAKAKAAAEKVLENEKKILELEQQLEENRNTFKEASEEKRLIDARNRAQADRAGASASSVAGAIAMQGGGAQEMYRPESTSDQRSKMKTAAAGMRSNKSDIQELRKANEKLSRTYASSKAFADTYFSDDGSDPEDQEEPGITPGLSDKEKKKLEAEAKRAAIKARKEFKEALKSIEAERDKELAGILAERAVGDLDYRKYQEQKYQIEDKFFKDSIKLYEQHNLKEDADHAELLKKRLEHEARYNEQRIALNKEAIQRIATVEERDINARYAFKSNKTLADEMKLKEELMTVRYNALADEQKLYDKGTKEYEEMERKIQDLLYSDMMDKKKLLAAKADEFQKKYDKLSVKEKYDLEMNALKTLYDQKYISEAQYQKWKAALEKDQSKDLKTERKSLPGAVPENDGTKAQEIRYNFNQQKSKLDDALKNGTIDADEYATRLSRIKADMNAALVDPLRTAQSEWVQMLTTAYQAWADFAQAIKDPEGDPFHAIANGITATAGIVTAIMSQITEFQKAEYEIQAAAVEKRYDREIAFAEGNAYLEKKLEKEKQEELDRLKAEQSKKNFQLQVIATIAQTAANAVQAYSAGLSIGGPAGLIMAPVAAALAVAQGAVQIALLKKQQQAAAAVGYSEGGFTRPGRVDEPAGIVHAGEWVASQKLVNSPNARPLIEYLEYAQRNNRIGSISMQDVSRSVAAPMFNAFAPEKHNQVVVHQQPAVIQNSGSKELSSAIADLVNRLDSPFITVNSVTGEGGINEAEKRYNRMIRNKSRRLRS